MRFSNSVAGLSFGSCGTNSPRAIKGLSLGKRDDRQDHNVELTV